MALKKNLLLCLFGLLLVSCKNEKDDPEPEVEYFPLEVTRTNSYSTHTEVSKYIYNTSNEISREDIFTDNALKLVKLYTYSAEGKLIKTVLNDVSGGLVEQNEFTYNNAKQVIRLSHAYPNAAGFPVAHHYETYAYSPDGKLATLSYFFPKTGNLPTDPEQWRYTYQVNTNTSQQGFYQDFIHPANNFTREVTLDGKKHPFSATAVNYIPIAGNETLHIVKDATGAVTNTIIYSISYNDGGYPESITQDHTNGTVKMETYTYKTF